MHVEIWSDIACPWCYIGKRRFEAALAQFEHRDEVRVTWRSFELDPEAPRVIEGDRAELLAAKYGTTVERAREMQQHVAEVAAGDGLEFHPDRARGGNTFDGHRLLHLAAEHGRQDALAERLMRAQQTDGEAIGDLETLQRLAVEAGLPADEVADLLQGDRYAGAVRDDERTAMAFGIRGVPCFVADRTLGASGAQPPEALLDFLREAWQRTAAEREGRPAAAG